MLVRWSGSNGCWCRMTGVVVTWNNSWNNFSIGQIHKLTEIKDIFKAGTLYYYAYYRCNNMHIKHILIAITGPFLITGNTVIKMLVLVKPVIPVKTQAHM